jgi:hypothetical protein
MPYGLLLLFTTLKSNTFEKQSSDPVITIFDDYVYKKSKELIEP